MTGKVVYNAKFQMDKNNVLHTAVLFPVHFIPYGDVNLPTKTLCLLQDDLWKTICGQNIVMSW